jgi:acetyltransferase-like isoleucine patch superfamily enzyme
MTVEHSGRSRPASPAQVMIQKLYRWAKHDPYYNLPDWFSPGTLFGELRARGIMALRGLVWRWRFRQTRGMIFIGADVRIRAPRLISVGRSVTFHDHVRIDGLCRDGIKMGSNVTIREYCVIECTGVMRLPGEGLVIGDDVGISQYGFIGVRGPVRIGNHVLMGPRVTIYAENHNFDDLDRLIADQGVTRLGITIEDDCWLGSGCTILDGVTIGRGSVVAAGCVVTKSVPPYSIVAGVPGHVVRQRGAGQPIHDAAGVSGSK